MLRLEDKIRKHADYFNDREPSTEHMSRFAERLKKQSAKRRITFWQTALKVAATALILISVSYFAFYLLKNQPLRQQNQVTKIEFSDDLNEILNYYDAASKLKKEEIEQLALNPEEALRIRKQAARQLENIDAMLAEIEKEYMKNPGNEQLRAALVNTKRKKVEVMDQITRQMEITYLGYYTVNKTTIQF